ncbi:MAG: hypothetical protein BWY35_00516 [Firmicutes bacterium ADurb.Bin248]|nr:MAG: hypothetical protein BWY35_00516 [Firmicutes bacterium ADurb.Bin248]HOG01701.1 hypothetical protein [Clostridia bacterium]HPK15879.1 hypothetical protein [Clostridia bacterium]
MLETTNIGNVNAGVAFNQGGGVSQAVGALAYSGSNSITVSQMSAYVIQDGAVTGSFQMAILQPTSTTSATVIALTSTASAIAPGLFTLPLVSPVTLLDTQIYYLAVYNQVSGSSIAGFAAGFTVAQDAPPINFRVQNIAGFVLGQTVSISDVSLQLSPWVCAHE